MRSAIKLAISFALTAPLFAGTFRAPAGAWSAILAAGGHIAADAGQPADIYVTPENAPAASDWRGKVMSGAALILQGSSPLAESFGFHSGDTRVSVVDIVDEHNPGLTIVWQSALDLPRTELPAGTQVFARERWSGASVIAGLRLGAGAVLWVAAQPGEEGYERFPYLIHALGDLGFASSFRASRIWAFFDDAYRLRADPDYLAAHWRAAGIAALHAAAWHFYDADPARDAYLRDLIAACHRHGILVYAWLELPHVSDGFWDAHPEWREKTALLQDAQLDWRKLMNLANPDCAAAVQTGLRALVRRFDWDGVNLAELYFESLEGAANPARFTPMNEDVRRDFRDRYGWDPLELWKTRKDAASLAQFLDFRAGLASRIESEWLQTVESFRAIRPGLDVVLTHVDDLFDSGMRDAIGADASRALPLLNTHTMTFLVEDPATVWNLGSARYAQIAQRYAALTAHRDRLAVDINIATRYQDVYPTKEQTGTELFELIHAASAAFTRVVLYFENSIARADLPFIAAASAPVTRYSKQGTRVSLSVDSDVELAWSGGALVDGKPWPLVARGFAHLPAGTHTVEPDPAPFPDAISISDLNATLRSASVEGKRARFSYRSDSRAIVTLDRKPQLMEIDGKGQEIHCEEGTELKSCTVLLPQGEHEIALQ